MIYAWIARFAWPLIGFAAFAAIAYGAYTYVENIRKDNVDLNTQNQALEYSATISQNTIYNLREDLARIRIANAKLEAQIEESEEYREYLIELYQKHDLTKLALAKPGLIEIRINAASKEVLDEFESITAK